MRIEITNFDEKSVDVDFEDGFILVNLTLMKSDIGALRTIIKELEDT